MKKYVVVALFSLIVFQLNAQTEQKFKGKWSVGISGGLDQIGSYQLNEKKLFPAIGVIIDYEFSRTWHLFSHIQYYTVGAKEITAVFYLITYMPTTCYTTYI